MISTHGEAETSSLPAPFYLIMQAGLLLATLNAAERPNVCRRPVGR